MSDLTGSNSKILMTFPFAISPVELQDFRMDGALAFSSQDLITTVFSLEGNKRDALIFNEKTITINFLATSPSIELFTRWLNEMNIQKSALNTGILEVIIFNLSKKYIFRQCALKSNKQIPDIQQQLGEVEIVMNCHPNITVMNI